MFQTDDPEWSGKTEAVLDEFTDSIGDQLLLLAYPERIFSPKDVLSSYELVDLHTLVDGESMCVTWQHLIVQLHWTTPAVSLVLSSLCTIGYYVA